MPTLRYHPSLQPGTVFELTYNVPSDSVIFDEPSDAKIIKGEGEGLSGQEALTAFHAFRTLEKKVNVEILPSMLNKLPAKDKIQVVQDGQTVETFKERPDIKITEGKINISNLPTDHKKLVEPLLGDKVT